MQDNMLKFVLPVLAPVIISIGACFVNNQILQARMEERVASIKEQAARHEASKNQDFSRLVLRGDDHEQRIVRLEANLGAIQEALAEMRKDIKTLLRDLSK